jgi:hypothetical protein
MTTIWDGRHQETSYEPTSGPQPTDDTCSWVPRSMLQSMFQNTHSRAASSELSCAFTGHENHTTETSHPCGRH